MGFSHQMYTTLYQGKFPNTIGPLFPLSQTLPVIWISILLLYNYYGNLTQSYWT